MRPSDFRPPSGCELAARRLSPCSEHPRPRPLRRRGEGRGGSLGSWRSSKEPSSRPPPLRPLFVRRVRKHARVQMWFSEADWSAYQEVLCAAPRAWAFIAFRTGLGGWLTGGRMQRAAGCVLGCAECSDTLAHYLICPRLLYWASVCLRSPLPSHPIFLLGLRGGQLAFCRHPLSFISHVLSPLVLPPAPHHAGRGRQARAGSSTGSSAADGPTAAQLAVQASPLGRGACCSSLSSGAVTAVVLATSLCSAWR